MAGRIDWDTGYDEAVEVNQRALIDKVLARYSAEFTVFRELLQNSDDAQSQTVEIHFQSDEFLQGKSIDDGPLPDLKTAPVKKWIFKNDGIAFRDEDWNRLKKIAEGNPDEDKIGAFGVGFYSLFSVTDEPKVLSGDQWMWFYWNKDQLIARRGRARENDSPNSINDSKKWTSFEMPLREEGPIPVAFDFTRFLASSITFMTHLSQVSVFFDDKCLTKLSKRVGSPKQLVLPSYLQARSRLNTMNITNLQTTPLHIRADVMRWVYSSGTEKPAPPTVVQPIKTSVHTSWLSSFFRSSTPSRPATPLPPQTPEPPVDHLAVSTTTVSLSIFSAQADARLDNKVATEIHRSTKKKPPARLKYDLIYTAKDQYDASKQEDEAIPFATGSIFQGLRADLEGTRAGRIFIGHATAQTTGLGGHMSSRFIPTVERESIDLMDRNVAIWNRELLYVGGIVARAVYELELNDIKMLWEGGTSTSQPIDIELQKWLTSRAIHALKFFTFHQSTPSPDISSLLEAGFFSCSPAKTFSIVSSLGIRDAYQTRMPDPSFTFLKNLPVLPHELLTEARPIVTSLQNRGLVRAICFEDVLNELRGRPLPEEEMASCLEWWTSIKDSSPTVLTSLLESALLITGSPGSKAERIIPLSIVQTFFNPRSGLGIPLDGPLPPHLLPVSLSKKFTPEQLNLHFQWKELSVLDWLQHVCIVPCSVEFDIRLSPPWAEKVLGVIVRAWPSASTQIKTQIISLLNSLPCIPTCNGMKKPEEAYFASADIFHDLPVVTLPSGAVIKGPMERVLTALNVRKHIDLQLVFDRMVRTREWTIAELVRYLVSVRDTLTTKEIDKLKETVAFTAEGGKTDKLYQARQLYEPLDIFRQLGYPVMDWGKKAKWRNGSDEAKFLFEIGLRRHPPLHHLIDICSTAEDKTRELALTYLLSHIPSVYHDYDPVQYRLMTFVPSKKDGKPCLRSPLEVYGNAKWAAFDLPILNSEKKDILVKLKIGEHPPSSTLVDILSTRPPKNEAQAKEWFQILAAHVGDFSGVQLEKISQLPIVPVGVHEKRAVYRCPSQCYFGQDARQTFHSKLFVFVDFGQVANGFLNACGLKPQPTTDEVAQILLGDPDNFYALAGSAENFLIELKAIAANYRLLSPTTVSRMKKTPVLLAFQRKHISGKGLVIFEDEEREMIAVGLKCANQIVIADDTNALQAFGDTLFTAPQDSILEEFYIALGSRRLTSLVKEDPRHSEEIKNSKQATEIRNLILERLPLFLHEHTHAKTRHSYSWLKMPNHFVVKTFGKVSITKSLSYAGMELSSTQEASAVSHQSTGGRVELWIAGHTQIDMYEVATSFNRFFFEAPKANDMLLFMTLLSSDLRSLKRRGYNVDRILREQDAQRQAIREAQIKASEEAANLPPPPPPEVPSSPPPLPPPPPPIFSSTSELTNGNETAGTRPKKVQKWLNNLAHNKTKGERSGIENRVTPLRDIAANIDMAVRGCRPESGNSIRNREEMQRVKESLGEGYCDVSGRTGDLREIGRMGEVRVYVAHDVAQPTTIMSEKKQSIARLIHIMNMLSQIYAVPLTSLHIFYDLAGGTIAFNRNGSIFFNLRYYEAWHDEDVGRGGVKNALISWYFTLAHEIAHNLVQPHNSEHEFYFAAICEKYVMNLGHVLATIE
ncbi:hypothetical protein E1B28_009910 [Marasmius oreades]|uniref:Sacsin/Nov domain-containing protein n=1 Tax=Marasmius oreades TaxID=181124 RepID=A0A9P7UQY7_9AGAR|nr:uncharacterized protein E1B28_009910 [Marasmius oreades]KAG7090828.1 hypothetical protein E1B28_009910 [Marasmius oreades]